jgi:hypothetical protein
MERGDRAAMRRKSTITHELDPERPTPLTAAQKAEVEALAALPEHRVDTSDIPPLPETFWQNAVRHPFYWPVKR